MAVVITDGLFGQCQAAYQQPIHYQVSVQTLHKLQDVLKDLMVQGEFLPPKLQVFFRWGGRLMFLWPQQV